MDFIRRRAGGDVRVYGSRRGGALDGMRMGETAESFSDHDHVGPPLIFFGRKEAAFPEIARREVLLIGRNTGNL